MEDDDKISQKAKAHFCGKYQLGKGFAPDILAELGGTRTRRALMERARRPAPPEATMEREQDSRFTQHNGQAQ